MSLSGTYDKNNIFAKIIRGEMSCVRVHEDQDIIVFMDVFPQSKGHTLVGLKLHHVTYLNSHPKILAACSEPYSAQQEPSKKL